MTIRGINKKLAPHNVRLVRGKGYFYYAYDDGNRFDTLSVYAYSLEEFPEDVWVSEGIAFADKVNNG